MDFRNNMQKVYVSEEEKEKFMEKLNRDVEVNQLLLLSSATGRRHHLWIRRTCIHSSVLLPPFMLSRIFHDFIDFY